MNRVVGVDDAGRGCIIGPLFIAGVSMEESEAEGLRRMGVRDSKLLSPQSRERLFVEVVARASSHSIMKIPPAEVDEYVRHKKKHTKLNYLEAIYMARVINALEGEVAYVDASDTNEDAFRDQVRSNLTREVKVVARHHADRDCPVVSAASILAKVSRDREIEAIKKEIGEFGSGYPSDPRTVGFLDGWMREHGKPPPHTRLTWKTWKRVSGGQARIDR